MSQQTVVVLALLALLLPTVGAILARLVGRKLGSRATQVVGALSFAVALASAVALRWADVDRADLGTLAIFVPATGPEVDAEGFTLPRRAPATPTVEEQVELALAEPTPTAVSTTPPVLSPTPTPSPTPTASPRLPPVEPPSPAVPTPAPVSTSTPTAPPATATRTPARALAYIVKPGDTLRSIAARLDISVDTLLTYNGLSRTEGDQLQPGQKLFIPPASSSPAQAEAPQPTARRVAPTSRPAPKPQLYIVEPGDTLRSIAARVGISVDALLSYNGLSRAEGDRLQPGQKLYIPPS